MDPRISGQWMPLSRRPSIRAMQGGGYEAVSRPNPNSGRALMSNVTPVDPLGHGLQERGMENRRQADLQHQQESIERGVGTLSAAPVDPFWEGFKQSLFEAGVDEVQTGAAGGVKQGGGYDVLHSGEGDNLTARQIGGTHQGFFDTQRPSMLNLRDIPHQRDISRLAASDVNRLAANYQNSRRR